ncbi:MAG: amidohydrolase family protein [Lachnospiraceae bacterium]|nr:amidohydrolase family protein [Lachnospiraceae bacterium]
MQTLILNGHLIDPSSCRDGAYDLLITDGRVSSVEQDLSFLKASADLVIDASGKVVAPGFVDIHMHEDPVGEDGRIKYCIFDNMLRMGVTTAVGGNCGSTCMDPGAYLDLVDAQGAPCNVAMFVGEISCREKAGAVNKYEKATPSQRRQIRDKIRNALDRGCVGLSYGVRYAPGADEEELMEAGSACLEKHRILSAHVRDDADRILPSIEEIAAIGRKFDLPVQISHIGSMGGFGQMKEVLEQIRTYRAEGLDIALDCYPYEAFSTEIGATTYDDGWMDRYHCGYEVLEFCEGKYKGQRATPESFADMRKTDPDALTVCYVMKEEDVRLALSFEHTCLGSDGILDEGQGHPRSAGAFPRFFSCYVKEGSISLYDAVYKTSTMAAKRLGLKGKGSLTPGADGDVVIFDPGKIRDRATFINPLLPPEGIDLVLINGRIAARDCQIVQKDLGRSVRV